MKFVTNSEIDSHDILDRDQRTMCKQMRTLAKGTREQFTLLDFAQIALRATASDYTLASDLAGSKTMADAALRRAAVLYVYEALRACDIALITEWSEFDEMLRSLATLAGDLP